MMGLAGKLMSKPYGSASGISFVSAASAEANTVALPAHTAGDLIIVFLFNNNSTTIPGTPTGGWTALVTTNFSAGGQAYRIVYKFATSSSETLGTSTNATTVSATVYRGVNASSPFGAGVSANTSAQSYITYPTLTAITSTTSWVVLLAGCSASGAAVLTTPASTTNRTTTVGGTSTATVNDTNGPVGATTWAGRNAAVDQVVFAMARAIEIVAA